MRCLSFPCCVVSTQIKHLIEQSFGLKAYQRAFSVHNYGIFHVTYGKAKLTGLIHPACVHACSVIQSRMILCDPANCSPPGSSVHGIFQVRILE